MQRQRPGARACQALRALGGERGHKGQQGSAVLAVVVQSGIIKSMDEDRAKLQKYIAKYERDVAEAHTRVTQLTAKALQCAAHPTPPHPAAHAVGAVYRRTALHCTVAMYAVRAFCKLAARDAAACICRAAAAASPALHSTSRCNTAHRVATQHVVLQHNTSRCNTAHRVAV